MQKLNSLRLPWPVDWSEVFGANRALILEIGFGRGVYLRHLSTAHPDANIVGLEISNRCMEIAERMIKREDLANVRVIHSTAETALHHLFEPQTLSAVHINFPDPWFKTRHGHRRLMQRDTLDAIVSRLVPGGDLFLATDIIEYAEMSTALLAETPGLENQLPTPWVYEMPGRVTTKYEATARSEGRPCHYFHYRRGPLPAPEVPVIKDLPMSHIIMTNLLELETIRERFEPIEISEGEVVVHIMNCYQGRHLLLFEAYVKEPTIDQRVAMNLHQRRSGDFTLQMNALGHPRVTEGIHRAIKLLSDWLLSISPNSEVVAHKLPEDD